MLLFGTILFPVLSYAERSPSIFFSNATFNAKVEYRPQPSGGGRSPYPRPLPQRLATCALILCLTVIPRFPLAADETQGPRAVFGIDEPGEAEVDGTVVDVMETNVPHVSLSWSIDGEEETPDGQIRIFTLQQSASADFSEARTLYEGQDRTSFRGGLPEGEVYFRVRAAVDDGPPGEWSRPLQVRITYQSMRDAILLFAIGGIVVLATLVLVVAGSRKDREEAREEENSS